MKKSKAPKSVDIIAIIDESGSMAALTDSTLDGYNGFIKEQQNVKGDANVTLVLFDSRGDDSVRTIYKSVPVKHLGLLTRETYNPNGGTPLYDAIGKTISLYDGKADKVVVVIITDGYENASTMFSHAKVKSLIEEKQARGWEFIFLGANIDKAVGYGLGIQNTFTFYSNSMSNSRMYGQVTNSMTSLRSAGTAIGATFDEEQLNVR